MNLEEAIKTAIEYENRVHATYKEAEERANDPVGKRVFGVLAKEELGHIEYLEHCLAGWQRDGKLTVQTLDTAIPPRDKIDAGAELLKERLGEKKSGSTVEIELLQRAIDVETETSSFYKKMVSELSDEGQQLFARFVEIEEGHLAIVKAEMDSVSGVGYWFDMPEWQFQE
jgi:rubrerythrin